MNEAINNNNNNGVSNIEETAQVISSKPQKEQTLEEKMLEQEVKFKEKEQKLKRDRQNALKLAMDRGNRISELEGNVEDLGMKFSNLENMYYSRLGQNVSTETREETSDPARIIARSVLKVHDNQLDEAKSKNKNRVTYWCF